MFLESRINRPIGEELAWDDIKLMDVYLYEESHYMQCEVEIQEVMNTDTEYRFRARVKEWLGGMGGRKHVGDEFIIEKSKVDSEDGEPKTFKPSGSRPQYL